MQTLGEHSRQLIHTIQKLQLLDIDATIPSLPKFVVVGDQSAGKSSIVEAICDITVPRDHGTCTRCPFQITTSAPTGVEQNWHCRVSLHLTHAYTARVHARQGPNDYDHWVEQTSTNVIDFAVVRERHQLQDVLRRAQSAILNPHRNPVEFLHSTPPSSSKLGFSPNAVSLQIEGPGLPELSFYDLPGAINVHEDGEDHLVTFIEKLIKNYLRDEKALVLLACSADQDIENSTAFKFVRSSNALLRCMGVLTKPDLIGPKRFELIRRILNGEVFKLGSRDAWFVTKQLDQEALDNGVTHHEARKREDEFFTDPSTSWSAMLSHFGNRFGTSNLQLAVSHKLTEHILGELPEIVNRVQSRLDTVERELSQFPDRPKSAPLTVLNECHNVVQAIGLHLRNDTLDNTFRTEYKGLIRAMQAKLRAARPQLTLSTPGYQKQAISLDSDEDATPMQSPAPETPSKVRKGNNSQPIRTPRGVRATTQTPRSGRVRNGESFDDRGKPTLRLDEIQEMYERGSNSGLPDQINPKVTERLIVLSLRPWKAIISEQIGKVKQHVTSMLEDSIEEALAKRMHTQLSTQCSEIVLGLSKKLAVEVGKLIDNIVACESQRPITYQGMKPATEHNKAKLLKDRLVERVNEHYDTLDANGYKVPQGAEREKKYAELEQTHLKTDEYAREVGAMATPLAYYDLASARMVDSIALVLDYNLLHALETTLREELMTGLRVTDEDYCVQLLAENPKREEQRAKLLAERARLSEALSELKGLPQNHGF